MKNINFKKSIEVLGYTIEKYIEGYNFRSAFASKDGKLFYFHIEDLRDSSPMVYRRTAESTSDYTGGVNLFDVESDLEELGYAIVEPRGAGDYNTM